MQLFGISNCSTVKKARDWLLAEGLAYEFYDFKKQGVPQDLLESWLRQLPWEKLINRSGMTWRNLSEAEKLAVMDAPSALKLMLEKPSVIKRPVLVKNGTIVCLGFTDNDYKKSIYKALL